MTRSHALVVALLAVSPLLPAIGAHAQEPTSSQGLDADPDGITAPTRPAGTGAEGVLSQKGLARIYAVVDDLVWVEPNGSVVDSSAPAATFLRLILRGTGTVVNSIDGSGNPTEMDGVAFGALNLNYRGEDATERREVLDLFDKCGRLVTLATARPGDWRLTFYFFGPDLAGSAFVASSGWLHVRIKPGDELRCRATRLN